MRRNKLSLFLHLVWATWDRLPLITVDIEPVSIVSLKAKRISKAVAC
jgi:hypothetical protein